LLHTHGFDTVKSLAAIFASLVGWIRLNRNEQVCIQLKIAAHPEHRDFRIETPLVKHPTYQEEAFLWRRSPTSK